MKVTRTSISDVLIIEPKVFGDHRGFFLETWSRYRYEEAGISSSFVQDNLARSVKGTLRGMHLQHPYAQAKLVSVVAGEVFDVAVDVRLGSPTFGQWVGVSLSGDNHTSLYIPAGFAHGYFVMSEYALFAYKCTELYHPEAEVGLAWNDPKVGIEWPSDNPILSEKDSSHQNLEKLAEIEGRLPTYGGHDEL